MGGERKQKESEYNPETSPKNNLFRENKQAKVLNEAPKKPPLPPPIIVSRVKDYSALYEALRTKGNEFKATMLNKEQVTLNVLKTVRYIET